MAYTPTPAEARRLERAVELAKFSEGERIFWLVGFVTVAFLILFLLAQGGGLVGAVGALGGLLILYWRLRGGHLARSAQGDRGLFGLNLVTREQRAFTALMLRYAFTGRNSIAMRDDHDPLRAWQQRVGRSEVAPAEE